MKNNKLALILLVSLTLTSLTACSGASSETSSNMALEYEDNYYEDNYNIQSNKGYDSTIGLASEPNFNYDYEENYEETYAEEYDSEDNAEETVGESNVENLNENGTETVLVESKLIYRADIAIETLDYNKTMSAIKNLISQYNAIIQSENEYNNDDNWYYSTYVKTAGTMTNSLSIRVPSDKYKDFIEEIDGFGKIRNKSTNIENISQKYYDTTIQIKALEKEEHRLLEMMDSAYSIEDMIAVEDRLSEVQSQLLLLQTDIKYMDMDVAYSYVNLSISEVLEYTPEDEPIKTVTFMDRLINTVKDTWKDFLEFWENLLFTIIRLLPAIIIISIILVIIRIAFWKKIKALKTRKKENGSTLSNTDILVELLKYNEEENKKDIKTEANKDDNKK